MTQSDVCKGNSVVLTCLVVRPHPGRTEGEELGAHLAHAHVVAEGAVDDRGVVIDIKDVHSQSVLLPPGRDAAI